MALRGTLTHRKTRRLAKALGIDPPFAMGILESLWHVTSENQHDGGIGRMSNQDIADEMYYSGDAEALIAALLKSGWLDAVEDSVEKGRLYVHDWHEHADDSTKSKLIQWTKLFANGEPPSLRKLSEKSRVHVIARYEAKFGGFIGQKMRCVRTEQEAAHDAHGAHIQKPESRSQSPEARVQKPEETNEETSIPVERTAPEPRSRQTRSSVSPIEIPSKRVESRVLGKNSILTQPRIDRMRAELQAYMQKPGHPPPKPPDDTIVLQCLNAVGDAAMDSVHQVLREIHSNGSQAPHQANGPKGYGWFPKILTAHFRAGPEAAQPDPEPAGARA